MSSPPASASARLGRRYRALLWLYPRRFRDEFGDELIAFVVQRADEPRYRDRTFGRLLFWIHLLCDLARSAPRAHVQLLTERWRHSRLPAAHHARSLSARRSDGAMDTLMHDVRFAVRTLRRRPTFTAVALLTLAVGIGANAAIFSVADTLLLRPLRYPRPEQLVMLSETSRQSDREAVSYLNFVDWRDQSTSFAALAVMRGQSINLTGGDTPERIFGNFVSGDYLRLFGAEPMLGRSFSKAEGDLGTAQPVVVLAEGLWRRRFGADSAILGRPLILNGLPFTVIGVMPSSFAFAGRVDAWLPIAYYPNAAGLTRGAASMSVVGRLKPTVSAALAQREMSTIGARLAQQYPETNRDRGVRVFPLHAMLADDYRSELLIVLGAVALVLLIACSNVASLQLSHALARRREMSVRAALGAGRSQLVRQLLTESVVVHLAGGMLGIAAAYWGVRGLAAVVPVDMSYYQEISLNGRVVTFAVALAALTGILFGLVPALSGSRADVYGALRARDSGVPRERRRLEPRALLVMSQIVLSLVLLVCAGLLTRSLVGLHRVQAGFATSDLVTMEFRLPATKYAEKERISAFFDRVIDEIRRVPGVRDAALVRAVPLSGNSDTRAYLVDGQPARGDAVAPTLTLNTVSPAYFRTMAIPLLAGRDIALQDDAASPGVILVNATFAAREWPGVGPAAVIGRRVRFGADGQWLTVIGIVGDVKHYSLRDPSAAQGYIPYRQAPQIFTSVVVRAGSSAVALGNAVRDAIWRVDKDQPVWKIRTMDEILALHTSGPRVVLGLMMGFALSALLLAGVGIYGVMSYGVAQRTREVGIRMALGAHRTQVVGLIVRQGLGLTLVATAIGLVAAFGSARLLAGQLFAIQPTDPVTFIVAPLVLLAVSVLACVLPARRASRLDPATALRVD